MRISVLLCVFAMLGVSTAAAADTVPAFLRAGGQKKLTKRCIKVTPGGITIAGTPPLQSSVAADESLPAQLVVVDESDKSVRVLIDDGKLRLVLGIDRARLGTVTLAGAIVVPTGKNPLTADHGPTWARLRAGVLVTTVASPGYGDKQIKTTIDEIALEGTTSAKWLGTIFTVEKPFRAKPNATLLEAITVTEAGKPFATFNYGSLGLVLGKPTGDQIAVTATSENLILHGLIPSNLTKRGYQNIGYGTGSGTGYGREETLVTLPKGTLFRAVTMDADGRPDEPKLAEGAIVGITLKKLQLPVEESHPGHPMVLIQTVLGPMVVVADP